MIDRRKALKGYSSAVALAAAVTAGFFATQSSRGAATDTPASQRPVLIELYQSQGCSSCPPANANLNALADQPNVIALSFGVTYWDYLGWKDSFAQKEFTDRQWDFARYNNYRNVATPQVWINGQQTIVGNNRAEFLRAIRDASSDGPDITIGTNKVNVSAGKAPAGGADVWVALYDPRSVDVPIARGENGGRTLPHKNIVRQLVKVGSWNGSAASFDLPSVPQPLAVASFVQAGRGGPIISAAKS